ncbi:MAG: chemotaxis protein CheW [Deltaproteobacteria bacterium]|nr:chemotaxis protein CheW [Deltaproteobacteria bacterium]
MSEQTALQQIAEDQLVTFSLGRESLAFPIGLVQEIVKPSAITRVPNAPTYVEGIANLRGNILPVVNLRKRLGMDLKEQDEDTRVVVLNANGAATGMVVDSVSEVLHVEKSAIEAPPDVVEGIDGQYLRGVANTDEGKRLTLILSGEKILPDTAGQKEIGASIDSGHGVTADERDKKKLEEEELLVTFRMAGEEFAVDIMQVQEIIRVAEITRVPRAPEFVKGITSLRNRLLPIVDLRALFGMTSPENDMSGRSIREGETPEADHDTAVEAEGADDSMEAASTDDDTVDARRIVVIDMDGVLTGILVDSVSEVLRLPVKSIEDPPSIINREQAAKLKGVGKLNNGERLVMLLDMGNLISADQKAALVSTAGAQGKDEERMAKEIMDEEQAVCFWIDKEEYGIDIMQVQEIIRVDEITAVPNAPRFVEGIVNLRGNVLPVLDMRTRFGLEKGERTEQNRIIVVDIAGKTTGIIVDSVSEVIRIPKDRIEPPPELITEAGIEGRYIEGIGKLDEGKRIIVLVQVNALLTGDEKEELSAVRKEEGIPGDTEKEAALKGPEGHVPHQEPSLPKRAAESGKKKTAAKAKKGVKNNGPRKKKA